MEKLIRLTKLLPKQAEIEKLVENEGEAAYILRLAAKEMLAAQEKGEVKEEDSEAQFLVFCLVEKCWERLHTSHFSEVPLKTRQIYALANYYKVFYLLFESLSAQQAEKCSETLDEAILLGYTQQLYENSDRLLQELMALLNDLLGSADNIELPTITPLRRQAYPCDIPQLDCPSVEVFQQQCFLPQQPTLLLNTIRHWPALEKWRNLNYLCHVAGNRTVPIEIGSNYATDEWSQQLIKIRDFLRRQFGKNVSDKNIEYLAQHELFDQIPALKEDIRIPDYCATATTSVDVKAWLGPKGTISPMHYDPKHNLLCQVFGIKRIILAAPQDSPHLYPHESEFLGNTSQLDAANLDLEKFPLTAKVHFYELTLQSGDCLYMPPKWWHYVRAESESFSVSFWWE